MARKSSESKTLIPTSSGKFLQSIKLDLSLAQTTKHSNFGPRSGGNPDFHWPYYLRLCCQVDRFRSVHFRRVGQKHQDLERRQLRTDNSASGFGLDIGLRFIKWRHICRVQRRISEDFHKRYVKKGFLAIAINFQQGGSTIGSKEVGHE